jgi:hypothetical protein
MYYNIDKDFLELLVIIELQEIEYARQSICMDRQKRKEDEENEQRFTKKQTVQNQRNPRNKGKAPIR